MTATICDRWIERQIAAGRLSPGARGMNPADAAAQYNEANALSPGDPGYLVAPRRRPSIDEPRIFCGCLHCYNCGRLVGHWFPASEGNDITLVDVHRGSRVDWKSEGCEELWCLDTENIPVSGEMSPMDAVGWGELYDEVDGDEEWASLCAWVRTGDYVAEGSSDISCLGDFRDRYCGHWNSFRDYAYQLVEDMGILEATSEEVQRYFDYDLYTNDLRLSGEYTAADAPSGGVYIFRSL